MTTYNHTLMATSLAILVQESNPTVKLAAGIGLLISHPLLDCLPHRHWFDQIKRGIKEIFGAIVEVFGGLIILPIGLLYFFHLHPVLLGLYIIAASGFDFLMVLMGQTIVSKINHRAHFWEKYTSKFVQISFELSETLILIFVMLFFFRERGGSF